MNTNTANKTNTSKETSLFFEATIKLENGVVKKCAVKKEYGIFVIILTESFTYNVDSDSYVKLLKLEDAKKVVTTKRDSSGKQIQSSNQNELEHAYLQWSYPEDAV